MIQGWEKFKGVRVKYKFIVNSPHNSNTLMDSEYTLQLTVTDVSILSNGLYIADIDERVFKDNWHGGIKYVINPVVYKLTVEPNLDTHSNIKSIDIRIPRIREADAINQRVVADRFPNPESLLEFVKNIRVIHFR